MLDSGWVRACISGLRPELCVKRMPSCHSRPKQFRKWPKFHNLFSIEPCSHPGSAWYETTAHASSTLASYISNQSSLGPQLLQSGLGILWPATTSENIGLESHWKYPWMRTTARNALHVKKYTPTFEIFEKTWIGVFTALIFW